MRRTLAVMAFVFLASLVRAQTKPAPPALSLGHLHHPIVTSSREAQRLFDEGLTFVYAFNHEEARRRFEHAAALDPKSPMPLWGVALAVGPNYNLDVDPAREKQASDAIKKAQGLAGAAPENERAYVEALARRYSDDPKADLKKLAGDYADAMRDLARRYPDDPDAGTLFAESLMDLNPWKLWSNDGKPGVHTEEIVAELERVLRFAPDHVGANHFYVHALEASPHPERALPSAKRLETLVPAAGHLVHMPAHIYQRTGDYDASVRANERAIAADRVYFGGPVPATTYGAMYFSHNVHFLVFAAMMEGRSAEATDAAAQLDSAVRPALKEMPMVEAFLIWPTFVLMRFNRWDDIQKLPAPDAELAWSGTIWHFARGTAFAATHQLEKARAERAAMEQLRPKIPAGPAFGMLYNDAGVLLDLAFDSLDARIALAAGDHAAAIASWRKAVAIQDAMSYDEPPEWFYPVRESLGAALLQDGQAAEAEAVFREDLAQNPRNPRSLFGLWHALTAQQKTDDAAWVHGQFLAAWKHADVSLHLADF